VRFGDRLGSDLFTVAIDPADEGGHSFAGGAEA
jgi:hypothetical protein